MIAWIRKWLRDWQENSRLRKLTEQSKKPDAGQRQNAAAGLAEIRDRRSAVALVPLLGDTHTPVREAAKASLGGLGTVAVGALLDGLKHSNAEVAASSAELLAGLGDPATVEPLIVALKFSPRPVQLAARRALIRLGAPATEALRAVAEDPQPWVRQQVAEILEQHAAGMPGAR